MAAGAAADSTALVATAGLFVRQLTAALSNPGWTEGVGAVGAVAGGGCGTPTGSDAGAGTVKLLLVPFVIADWLLFGDVIRGVEIGCVVVIGGIDDEPKPLASVVNGCPIRLFSGDTGGCCGSDCGCCLEFGDIDRDWVGGCCCCGDCCCCNCGD